VRTLTLVEQPQTLLGLPAMPWWRFSAFVPGLNGDSTVRRVELD
jgi:hypothetical protein